MKIKKYILFLLLLLPVIISKPVFAAEYIITIVPADINFGSVVAGEEKIVSATIINHTGSDVQADDLISVQNSANFSVDLVGVLAPNAGRSIIIRFKPLDKGAEVGQIILPGNTSVTLRGEGIESDERLNTIKISPETVDFGSFDVGGSEAYTVTAEISDSETAVISPSLSSNTSNAFFFINSCPEQLSGRSCTIEVVFQPPEDGYYASILLINDGTSTHSITLKGKGGAISEFVDDDSFCFITTAADTGKKFPF